MKWKLPRLPKAPKTRLSIEQLEGRIVPCVMPNVTPAIYAAMTAEVQHVLDLVPTASVTDEAIKSGNYSDASIWSAGHAPTASDKVLIDSNVSVVVDNIAATAKTMRVDGQLKFSQTANSLLTVDTIVINAGGDLEMVSPNPSIHTGLTFSDSGAIDRTWDPYGLSRQLIALGDMAADGTMSNSATVNIAGAATPVWTDPNSPNLIRNVVIQSANISGDVQRNGAVMFMHTAGGDADGAINQWGTPQAVALSNADFINLGRTDKSKAINDSVVVNGVLQAGTGTNPRARYAIHFHRDENFDPSCTVQVTNCVVEGGPGWGFVNHSSNVNFQDDIATGVFGAGFATESGNEMGAFTHDLALNETSTLSAGNNEDGRKSNNDFGFSGVGFWFQSGYGFTADDNTAIGAHDAGFVHYGRGLNEGSTFGTIGAVTAFLADPSLGYKTWNGHGNTLQAVTPVDRLPIQEFVGNTAIGCRVGEDSEWVQNAVSGDSLAPNMTSTIDTFTSLDTGSVGVSVGYEGRVNIVNSKLMGAPGAKAGVQLIAGYTFSVSETNCDIENFAVGVNMSSAGLNNVITDGTFNNQIDILVANRTGQGSIANRTIQGDVNFLDNNTHYQLVPLLKGNNNSKAFNFQTVYFRPNYVFVNTTDNPNSQLYYPDQAGSNTPFTAAYFSAADLALMPSALLGLTNDEAVAAFGTTFLGESAPADAVALANSNALIGSRSVVPTNPLTLKSPSSAVAGPYSLSYSDGSHTFTQQASIVLGWNLEAQTYNGSKYPLWVLGK